MKCPQCATENADGKNFCSACGSLLSPQLLPIVRAQVEEYMRQHFKEQKLVEVETSEAVSERVLKWAKYYYGFPVAVLLVILALLGISDYSDFRKTIHRATEDMKPKVDQAITEADKATKTAEAAETKSEAASKLIEDATAKMNTQVNAANQVSNKVSGLESQTENKILETNTHIQNQVDDLNKKLEAANKIIVEQQVKLTSTNDLVAAMFSKGRTQYMSTLSNDATCVTIPNAGGKGAQVFMLLEDVPIFQTLQLQWHIYSQPKYSYVISGNILRFNWGDPAENLKQYPLVVSYVPDPTYRGPKHSALSVRDGEVFADGVAIEGTIIMQP